MYAVVEVRTDFRAPIGAITYGPFDDYEEARTRRLQRDRELDDYPWEATTRPVLFVTPLESSRRENSFKEFFEVP